MVGSKLRTMFLAACAAVTLAAPAAAIYTPSSAADGLLMNVDLTADVGQAERGPFRKIWYELFFTKAPTATVYLDLYGDLDGSRYVATAQIDPTAFARTDAYPYASGLYGVSYRLDAPPMTGDGVFSLKLYEQTPTTDDFRALAVSGLDAATNNWSPLYTVEFFSQQPAAQQSTAQQFASQQQIAAVPEPATWLMMIGGFGVLGAALRRSRAPVLAR